MRLDDGKASPHEIQTETIQGPVELDDHSTGNRPEVENHGCVPTATSRIDTKGIEASYPFIQVRSEVLRRPISLDSWVEAQRPSLLGWRPSLPPT